MRRLRESLTRDKGGATAIVSKALYGTAGIGKTRAAVEYAWAYREVYTALLSWRELPQQPRRIATGYQPAGRGGTGMRRALTIGEKSFERDHPTVAIRLNNLAEMLRSTNRLVEAEPLYRRALAVNEASLGPDHSSVAVRLNNLAL